MGKKVLLKLGMFAFFSFCSKQLSLVRELFTSVKTGQRLPKDPELVSFVRQLRKYFPCKWENNLSNWDNLLNWQHFGRNRKDFYLNSINDITWIKIAPSLSAWYFRLWVFVWLNLNRPRFFFHMHCFFQLMSTGNRFFQSLACTSMHRVYLHI